jgi:hypothetical protein
VIAMDNELYIGAKELMKLLPIKKTKAYELIRKANKELKEQGYFTIAGKVPRAYLFARMRIEA